MILDSRTLESTPESCARAGYDGAKRRKGSKVHLAIDALGQLLARYVIPANERDRAQVEQLAYAVQELTGQSVVLAYVDPGYTGEVAREAEQSHGIELEVEANRGFVLLPRRWVVERSFAWVARFRCLARWSDPFPRFRLSNAARSHRLHSYRFITDSGKVLR